MAHVEESALGAAATARREAMEAGAEAHAMVGELRSLESKHASQSAELARLIGHQNVRRLPLPRLAEFGRPSARSAIVGEISVADGAVRACGSQRADALVAVRVFCSKTKRSSIT
jgi:hypothetical protein